MIILIGEIPALPEGVEDTKDGNKPKMGGGMNLSEDVVSIMDYLTQSVENIKKQLKEN